MDEQSNTGRKLSDSAGKHPVPQSGSARKGGELRFSGSQPHSLMNFPFSLKGYQHTSTISEKRLLWNGRRCFSMSSAEVTAQLCVISL